VLIADLGFSAMWNDKTVTSAPCGSLFYASPEIIKDDGVYFGPEVDVWSLGATLYTMTCGKLPFSASDDDDIRLMIEDGDFSSFPYFISQQLRNLITVMLDVNPFTRIKMVDVVKHPWLTKGDASPHKKVGNPRRHSTTPVSANSGLMDSSKAIHVFQSKEVQENGLHKEIVEQKVPPIAIQQKTASKAAEEAPPKTPKKEKNAKKEKKSKGSARGKEKKKRGSKRGDPLKIMPIILEDHPLPWKPLSATDLNVDPGEKAKTKWTNMLTSRQSKKKKRHSILVN